MMLTASPVHALSVLDERLVRDRARARSHAINTMNYRRGANVGRTYTAPRASAASVPPKHTASSAAATGTRLDAPHLHPSVHTLLASSSDAGTAAAMSGTRKQKYGGKALEEDALLAREDVDLVTSTSPSGQAAHVRGDDVEAEAEELEPAAPAKEISLLDVAVTRPLKGRAAFLAEYELVQKPARAAPKPDTFDDSDWEKVESEEDDQPEEEGAGLSRALYAEVAAMGGQK